MSATVINHQQLNLLSPEQWVAPKLGLSNDQYMCILGVEYHLYMNSSPHNHLMINTIFHHFFKCGEIERRQLCVQHINDALSPSSPFKLVYSIQQDTNLWTLSVDQMNHKPQTMPPTVKEQLGSSSVIGQKRPSCTETELKEKMRKKFSAEYMRLAEESREKRALIHQLRKADTLKSILKADPTPSALTLVELKEKMRKKFSAEYMQLAEESREKRALDKLISRYHVVKFMFITGLYSKGQGPQFKQAIIQQAQDFSVSLQKVIEEGDNDVTQWHHKFNAVCFAECSNSIMSMLWGDIKEDIVYELGEVRELQMREACVNATRLKIREVRLSQYLEKVKVVIDYGNHQHKSIPLPHSVPVEIAQARPRESDHKRYHGTIDLAGLIEVAQKLQAWGARPENVDRIVKPSKR